MHKYLSFFILLLIGVSNCTQPEKPDETVSENWKIWHPVTLTFSGPETSEMAPINPFLDYRLNVWFIHDGDSMFIPGFYAADGNASQTGAGSGNIWKVRFTPYKHGTWKFRASFRQGHNIAVNDSLEGGQSLAFDGMEGVFEVAPAGAEDPGFYGKGRLQYRGERYLRFAGSGRPFLKGGTDSPENFLAYSGFDQTPPSHHYKTHVKDWQQGDPVWGENKGKGIIGALNYLHSQGMNVVYFLTMNVLGDGNDVFPWTSREERYRFDCSKLDQWDVVFDHFDKLGIQMHVVTQENENQLLLDAGFTDVQRKLYYRELIARFSHHLGVVWNMGEENGRAPWFDLLGQTDKQRLSMADYLRKTDPYNNLLVFHTLSADPERHQQTAVLLGNKSIDGVSLQIGDVYEIHEEVKKWVKISTDSAQPWVVNLDEIGPYYRGVVEDSEDPGHDTIRVQALWGTYMAGGAGVEWYYGNTDLTAEDFRTREGVWRQTRYAMQFFEDHLPFTEMEPYDELITAGGAWCLAKPGDTYAVYLTSGNPISLNLSDVSGDFNIIWYNPRKGITLQQSETVVKGGNVITLTPPVPDPRLDWAVLLQRKK